MADQRDDTHQLGGSTAVDASGAGQTTGASMLHQSAPPSEGQQFGGASGGHEQQGQRGASGESARAPKELLKQTADDLMRGGGEVARAATHGVETLADDQKSRASSYVETIARAIQAASQSLEGEGFGGTAHAIDRVAEEIEDFAATLRSRDPRQLIDDVNGFARHNPALFLGASMLAGMGLARFVKSGPTSQSGQQTKPPTGSKP